MAERAKKAEYRFTVNGREISTDDPVITGRDISGYGDVAPASDFTVVHIVDGGTQAIGLDEKFDLRLNEEVHFRLFRGDRLFRALLNEHEIVWGDEEISADDLRLIGQIPEDLELVLDSDRDRVIADDGVVRLRKDGVERVRSREPEDKEVHIILNGEQVTVAKGKLSFSELAKLAFPKLFGKDLICFTVSFSRGPKRRPQGVLVEGGKVRVVEGMVFNVSATDKS